MPPFAVGYRVLPPDDGLFSDIVIQHRGSIREVYFAWPGEPSGRDPVDRGLLEQVQWELERIGETGVDLHLLLNASCYGDRAVSVVLADHVLDLVGSVSDRFGIRGVTTMSPLIARTVTRAMPHLAVRASVNMRLGTVQSLRYVAHLFDEYCVQREFNRAPNRLRELQAWAAEHGKRLHVLANSGCMNYCSVQTFHDNAVAHGADVRAQTNVADLTTLCREYYRDRRHWVNLLSGSSWIRPEDIAAHRRLFDGGYKLATRLHDHPRRVIGAYARGRYHGNLLDLLEPGFGPLLYPNILDNNRFPPDWFERSTACGACPDAGYCATVMERVLVNAEACPAILADDSASDVSFST